MSQDRGSTQCEAIRVFVIQWLQKNTKLWVSLALNWLDEIFGIEDQPFRA